MSEVCLHKPNIRPLITNGLGSSGLMCSSYDILLFYGSCSFSINSGMSGRKMVVKSSCEIYFKIIFCALIDLQPLH